MALHTPRLGLGFFNLFFYKSCLPPATLVCRQCCCFQALLPSSAIDASHTVSYKRRHLPKGGSNKSNNGSSSSKSNRKSSRIRDTTLRKAPAWVLSSCVLVAQVMIYMTCDGRQGQATSQHAIYLLLSACTAAQLAACGAATKPAAACC